MITVRIAIHKLQNLSNLRGILSKKKTLFLGEDLLRALGIPGSDQDIHDVDPPLPRPLRGRAFLEPI
jgi:hypothetical protein